MKAFCAKCMAVIECSNCDELARHVRHVLDADRKLGFIDALSLAAGDEEVSLSADSVAVTSAKWNLLFPIGARYRGDFPGEEGKMEFTREYLQTMIDNWKRHGAQPMSMDYFHLGASHVAQHVPIENKVASGDIVGLELREAGEHGPAGLYALTEWTDRAKKHIDAKELKRLSPYFRPNPVDSLTGKRMGPQLLGAGLLNDPFFDDLPRVAASRTVVTPRDAAPHVTQNAGDELMLAALIALLGLKKEATEADVTAAITKMQADHVALSTEANTLRTAKKASDDALALAAANNGDTAKTLRELQAENAKLKEAARDSAIALAVEKLEAGEHILPAQRDQVKAYALATSPEKAIEFFSAFKVPVSASTTGKGIPGNDRTVDPTAPAASPKEANEKLIALARERAEKSGGKEDLAAAMSSLMADPAHDKLVALAMQNTSKREN